MSKALTADRSWPSLTGMARQSIHQRFDIRSTEFFMAVLCDLMQQCYRTIATAVGSRAIQRILIEDAPGQVMPKFNADAFPAHGNHYGKTAGVKIDFALDLLAGSIVSQSLQAATEQDKSFGKNLSSKSVAATLSCEIWVTSASTNSMKSSSGKLGGSPANLYSSISC